MGVGGCSTSIYLSAECNPGQVLSVASSSHLQVKVLDLVIPMALPFLIYSSKIMSSRVKELDILPNFYKTRPYVSFLT